MTEPHVAVKSSVRMLMPVGPLAFRRKRYMPAASGVKVGLAMSGFENVVAVLDTAGRRTSSQCQLVAAVPLAPSVRGTPTGPLVESMVGASAIATVPLRMPWRLVSGM